MRWESGFCISILAQETQVCTADLPDRSLAPLACLCLHWPHPLPHLPHFSLYLHQYLESFLRKQVLTKSVYFLLLFSWTEINSEFIFGEKSWNGSCCFQFLGLSSLVQPCWFLSARFSLCDDAPSFGDWFSTSLYCSEERKRAMDGWVNVSKGCALPPPECPDGWVHVWICGCVLIHGNWPVGAIDFLYFLVEVWQVYPEHNGHLTPFWRILMVDIFPNIYFIDGINRKSHLKK